VAHIYWETTVTPLASSIGIGCRSRRIDQGILNPLSAHPAHIRRTVATTRRPRPSSPPRRICVCAINNSSDVLSKMVGRVRRRQVNSGSSGGGLFPVRRFKGHATFYGNAKSASIYSTAFFSVNMSLTTSKLLIPDCRRLCLVADTRLRSVVEFEAQLDTAALRGTQLTNRGGRPNAGG